MAEGEFALGGQHLEQALYKPSLSAKWGSLPSDLDIYASLVDMAMLQRDLAALRKYGPSLEEMAARLDHRLYLAAAHRALGVTFRLASEHSHAQTRLEQALSSFEVLATRWQIGRTLIELAELARDQSDLARARSYLTSALRAFEAQGARPAAERTRALRESL